MAMAAALMAAQFTFAQDVEKKQRPTPEQRTERRIKKLDEKLSLTDDQKSQIRSLYAAFDKQELPKGERKEAREKLIADISAVLTADQQELYKQLQQEADEEMRGHKGKAKGKN